MASNFGAADREIPKPAAIHRLLDALVILEAYPDPMPPRERTRLSYLVLGCLSACKGAVQRATPLIGRSRGSCSGSGFAELQSESPH